MPQVVTDLYRDLRDRRLLPVVGLLLVALIVVPVALSASSEAPSTVDPITEAGAQVDAPETQAAVLAETTGLRSYRKRLGDLQRRNPFRQKFQSSGVSRTEVAGALSQAAAAVSAQGGAATGADTGVSTDTGSASTTGSGGSEPAEEPAPETVRKLETFRVDVSFGAEGGPEKKKRVKPLDSLPPVAVFVGVSEDGGKALFFVSSDVHTVTGDGECLALGSSGCGLLVLEKGAGARLEHEPDAKAYGLKVSAIKRVLVR